MGAANVIPGVSGGTIAFITGIYERLINALKSCDINAIKLLLKRDLPGFAQHIDLFFIASLGTGMVTGILTLAKVLKYAFESHPVIVAALFFGLILASVFSVGRLVSRWSVAQYVALLIGLSVAVSMAFIEPASESQNTLYLMVCGVAAMCSMIIPGISGSFVLLLLGNYQLIMIQAISDLTDLNFSASLPILIPVGIGAVLGLIALSHVLSWLFKRYHSTAIALITGFVAGSLVIIWPWKLPVYSLEIEDKIIGWNRTTPDFQSTNTWIALAWLIGGIAIIVMMEKLSSKKPS